MRKLLTLSIVLTSIFVFYSIFYTVSNNQYNHLINIVETFQDFYDEEDALLVEFYSNDNHEKNNIIELIEILKENDYHAFYSTSEIRDGFIKDQIIYIYTSNNLTKDKLIYTKNINHLNFVSSKGFFGVSSLK